MASEAAIGARLAGGVTSEVFALAGGRFVVNTLVGVGGLFDLAIDIPVMFPVGGLGHDDQVVSLTRGDLKFRQGLEAMRHHVDEATLGLHDETANGHGCPSCFC